MIPVSTAAGHGWPWWLYKADNKPLNCVYRNNNNVLIGMVDKELVFPEDCFNTLDEQCQKECPYKDKVPNCQFMLKYSEYLNSLDFNQVLHNLNDIAEYAKNTLKFTKEPIIVLMVYEAPSRKCSERPCLQQFFSNNGIELKEWTKQLLEEENKCLEKEV